MRVGVEDFRDRQKRPALRTIYVIFNLLMVDGCPCYLSLAPNLTKVGADGDFGVIMGGVQEFPVFGA